jgi:hypothetical protein
MKLARVLLSAATCGALIIARPFGSQVIGPPSALAHGSNGGAAGGGGHGGAGGGHGGHAAWAADGSQAAGHSDGKDHAGMEHASHRSRSSCGGAAFPYTGPDAGHASAC